MGYVAWKSSHLGHSYCSATKWVCLTILELSNILSLHVYTASYQLEAHTHSHRKVKVVGLKVSIATQKFHLEDDLHLVFVALALLVAGEPAAAVQGGRGEARVRPHPLSGR